MKDQLDREFPLDAVPKRIVSLVPSQTELLCDLGLESSLVGVTKFCVHPHFIRKKVSVVGGTKTVHYDKILELQPDIILCNKEENTKEMILELEKIAPVHISDIYTLEDCYELISMYGNIFSKEVEAQKISADIKLKAEEFKQFISEKPKLKTAYFIWKNPWMVAAKNTFIDSLLKLNRFENYYQDLGRYPEVDLDLNSEQAELVLLSSEPFPFKESHIEEMQAFFPNAKVLVVDGEMFSWYGSRLQKAFDYFKKLHKQSSVNLF
ncbi:MAG TPA: helical backbone metal receptor [Flavobacteriaceae bacterium]|nr:helical backbone metal receptor [Flavobacteriaceae bacterium]